MNKILILSSILSFFIITFVKTNQLGHNFNGTLTRSVLKKWYPAYKKAQTINLAKLNITHIDETIFDDVEKLDKLKHLYLRMNQLKHISKNLLNKCDHAINFQMFYIFV